MSDNASPFRKPPPSGGPVVAEWDVKMRMVFAAGPAGFEFDLPPMSMTPNYIDHICAAFRAAVERACEPKEGA